MDTIGRLRDEAVRLIERALGKTPDEETRGKIRSAVEEAVYRSALHGHQSAIDAMLAGPPEDQDKAHKLAEEVRRRNAALIANLTSQR